jgi:hypothetical protein
VENYLSRLCTYFRSRQRECTLRIGAQNLFRGCIYNFSTSAFLLYLITNSLAQGLFEQLIVAQLVKKFQAFKKFEGSNSVHKCPSLKSAVARLIPVHNLLNNPIRATLILKQNIIPQYLRTKYYRF